MSPTGTSDDIGSRPLNQRGGRRVGVGGRRGCLLGNDDVSDWPSLLVVLSVGREHRSRIYAGHRTSLLAWGKTAAQPVDTWLDPMH
ncbi:hypothetical protein SUGI_0064870 [Cryptomeria japonica]|nr:hypothetical protein SUGI_0064870 [Cryptomeria japonica]